MSLHGVGFVVKNRPLIILDAKGTLGTIASYFQAAAYTLLPGKASAAIFNEFRQPIQH